MAAQWAETMQKMMELIRTELDLKKDLPAYWIDFYLLVVAAGEKGISSYDACRKVGMNQPIASRMLAILGEGQYKDRYGVIQTGLGIYKVSFDDPHYRSRTIVRLARKGQELADKLDDLLR